MLPNAIFIYYYYVKLHYSMSEEHANASDVVSILMLMGKSMYYCENSHVLGNG